MARPVSKHPTELELEILKVLWRDGPLSGRAVRDALAEFRDLAYTSVMTVMNIMEDKGYVRRKKVNGSFVYSAKVSRDSTTKRMLRDLVDRVFEGSTMSVMLNLLETGNIDPNELEQLREFVKRKTEENDS